MVSCLGCLLTPVYRYYEGNSEAEFDLHTADGYLAGLGTGLLATAAVSLSSTVADLPLAGAEVVRVAFRLGVLVYEVSQNLQPCQPSTEAGPGESWAYVVPDVAADEVQKELDAIHSVEVGDCPRLRVLEIRTDVEYHPRKYPSPAKSS